MAEELSEHELLNFLRRPDIFHSVYGSENVTSGASSDIRSATDTARAMVTVNRSFFLRSFPATNRSQSCGGSPNLAPFSTTRGMEL